MTTKASRCYHGARTCRFCGWPLKPPTKARRRCVSCGRFLTKTHPDSHCYPCVARGFRALTLF